MLRILNVFLALLVVFSTAAGAGDDQAELETTLRATESAFARSMADRDHAAFARFLSPEAVFFGSKSIHRGSEAIAAAWKSFFADDDAPFSWEPESVAVLESGTLGVTSGPVFDPEGKRIGTFNSVWRLDDDGLWRVVFDRGCPPCDCR